MNETCTEWKKLSVEKNLNRELSEKGKEGIAIIFSSKVINKTFGFSRSEEYWVAKWIKVLWA